MTDVIEQAALEDRTDEQKVKNQEIIADAQDMTDYNLIHKNL